jgi:hypothetical protein
MVHDGAKEYRAMQRPYLDMPWAKFVQMPILLNAYPLGFYPLQDLPIVEFRIAFSQKRHALALGHLAPHKSKTKKQLQTSILISFCKIGNFNPINQYFLRIVA